MSDEVARPKGATARERAQRIGRLLSEFNLGDGRMDAIEREILAAEQEAFVEGFRAAAGRESYVSMEDARKAWLRSRREGSDE